MQRIRFFKDFLKKNNLFSSRTKNKNPQKIVSFASKQNTESRRVPATLIGGSREKEIY